MTTEVITEERVIWRQDLCALLQVGSECMRRYIRDGKVPKPDVDLSRKKVGWRLSTLHAAGIRIA